MPAARRTPSFDRSTCRSRRCSSERSRPANGRRATAIPREIALAARFGVSQGTVRKAIDALAADNLVVRRQGKGTFVATHTEERASLFRFLRIRRNDGADEYPGEPTDRRRRGKAGADVARAAGIKQGDARATSCAGCSTTRGEPVVLDEITLPAALFRGLTKARYDAYRGSMYGFFETEFGVRMLQAEERSVCRGRRSRGCARAGRCRGHAAARRRPRHAHVRRPPRGSPPRPVRDATRIITERAELTRGAMHAGRCFASSGATGIARRAIILCCAKSFGIRRRGPSPVLFCGFVHSFLRGSDDGRR